MELKLKAVELRDDRKALQSVAENILNRAFTTTQQNKAWVSDITYVATEQGWLYLTTVIDLYDRKIIG